MPLSKRSVTSNGASHRPATKRLITEQPQHDSSSTPHPTHHLKTLKHLGSGSYAQAYLAQHPLTNHLYVIKRIPLQILTHDEKRETMREVEILRRFVCGGHVNIVRYYYYTIRKGGDMSEMMHEIEEARDDDSDDELSGDKHLDIVMEYCDRGNLEEHLRERDGKLLLEHEVMHIFVQIASALCYVHEKKILHRDLKAQNVFLSSRVNGTASQSLVQSDVPPTSLIVKLGDFGISKILDGTQVLARTMVGTPYYLSPELVNDEPYGMKSDMWSLGCILYNLCTLKHAWEGRNLPALVLKIVSKDYEPIGSHYSAELKDIVYKLLQKDPNKRPTIQELMNLPYMRYHLREVEKRIESMTNNNNKVPHSTTSEPQETGRSSNLVSNTLARLKALRQRSKNRHDAPVPSKPAASSSSNNTRPRSKSSNGVTTISNSVHNNRERRHTTTHDNRHDTEAGVDPTSPATIRCKLDFSSDDDSTSRKVPPVKTSQESTSSEPLSPAPTLVRVSLADHQEESFDSSSAFSSNSDLDEYDENTDSEHTANSTSPPSAAQNHHRIITANTKRDPSAVPQVRVSTKPPFYIRPDPQPHSSARSNDAPTIYDTKPKIAVSSPANSAASFDSFEDMYIQAQDVTEEEKQYISTWYSKYQHMIQDIQSELKEPGELVDLSTIRRQVESDAKEKQRESRINQRRVFYRDMLLKQHRILQENNSRGPNRFTRDSPSRIDSSSQDHSSPDHNGAVKGKRKKHSYGGRVALVGPNNDARRKLFLKEKKQQRLREKEEERLRKKQHQSRLKNAQSRIKIERGKRQKSPSQDDSSPSTVDANESPQKPSIKHSNPSSIDSVSSSVTSSKSSSQHVADSDSNVSLDDAPSKPDPKRNKNRDMFREFLRRKRKQTNKENKEIEVELVLPSPAMSAPKNHVRVESNSNDSGAPQDLMRSKFPNIELVLPETHGCWVDESQNADNRASMEHIFISKRGSISLQKGTTPVDESEMTSQSARERFVALRLDMNPPTPREVAQRHQDDE